MAVAPLRRRAGLIEIKNKEIKVREELKKRGENMKKQEITPEEHEKRLKLLKEIGVLK